MVVSCLQRAAELGRLPNSMKSLIKWWMPSGMMMRHNAALTARDRMQKQEGLYRDLIKPGDIAFDIGANIGNRIDALLAAGATVVAVEPQPACAAGLTRNYSGNRKVTVVQSAAGSKLGKLPLKFAAEGDVFASMSSEFISSAKALGRFGDDGKWNHSIEVEVTTLDLLISKYGRPAFIKIDVEGFEHEVLAGLSHYNGAISFEWTPDMPAHAVRCIEQCERLGLKRYSVSFGEDMKLTPERGMNASEVKQLVGFMADEHKLFGDIYAFSA